MPVGLNGAAFGKGDDKAGALRGDPLLRRLDDQPQQVRVAQPRDFGHQIELAVPAPAGVRVDLEQFHLAGRIGAKVKAGMIATAEPLEKDVGIIGNPPPRILVEPRLAIGDLRPLRRIGEPFRFVGQEPRQRRIEPGIVDVEDRQHAAARSGIADDADAVFRTGQELLDQDRAVRQLLTQGVKRRPSLPLWYGTQQER